MKRLSLLPLTALAREIHAREVDLRVGVSLVGRQAIPAHCLRVVLAGPSVRPPFSQPVPHGG